MKIADFLDNLLNEGLRVLRSRVPSGNRFLHDSVQGIGYHKWVLNCISFLGGEAPDHVEKIKAVHQPNIALYHQAEQIFGILQSAVEFVRAKHEHSTRDSVQRTAPQDEVANLENFLRVNLRRALFAQPDQEIQVQDAVEAILIGRGLAKGRDYDRETGRIKVSVKEVVPDFVFPRLSLALEIKLSKASSNPKALVDEIINSADIRAYGKQYLRQIYLVYDLGTIRDEAEFANDLDNASNVSVIVVKH